MNRLCHLIIFAALLLVCGNLKAQIFYYDFEQCNVGDKVAETLGEPWTTWNQNPGSAEDAIISDEQCIGTRALKIDNGNDVVLLLGDKGTGAYRISFDMFVPEGKEGYFNILHEFAGSNSSVLCNVWFNSESNGDLINGMSMSYSNVTFQLNTWNNIIIEYYVDDAMACIKINNEIVCLGKSFYENHNLAGIDFWPCSNNNDRNGFFIDNVSFDEIEGPLIHSISVSPDEINAVMGKDDIDNDSYSFELVNEGNTMARITTWVDYGVGEEGGSSDLHYDSDPYDTYGHYNNNPYIEIGIRYQMNDLVEHNAIGRKIKGMEYFVPATFETGGSGPITFRIYKFTGFGNILDTEILAEKVVNSFNYGSWLNVEFDEPIPLSGYGLVATVGFQQANYGYPISIDAGPANSYYGNLVRLNNSTNWSYINDGNNNIRLLCTGQPVVSGWVQDSFYSWGDILYLGDDKDYPLSFNTNGLNYGNYEALLHIEINNDHSLEITVPINLQVSATGVGELTEDIAKISPNPTSGIISIEAEGLQRVSIINALGQQVYDGSADGDAFECDLSNHEAGIYLIRMETVSGITTKRVILTK